MGALWLDQSPRAPCLSVGSRVVSCISWTYNPLQSPVGVHLGMSLWSLHAHHLASEGCFVMFRRVWGGVAWSGSALRVAWSWGGVAVAPQPFSRYVEPLEADV